MATRGRPDQRQHTIITHVTRNQQCIQVKELWTEHKIVLIAYEAQFMYRRKAYMKLQNKEKEQSKPKNGKKNNEEKKRKQQFQSSFVYMDEETDSEIEAIKQIKERKNYFPNLYKLIEDTNEDMEDLKQMVCILLEIKHKVILEQFMEVYQIIIKDIYNRQYQYEQQESRRNWQKQILEKIMTKIKSELQIPESEGRSFKYFERFIQQSKQNFQKFMIVTAYSFLAEKFNFSINQYYSDAFTIIQEPKQENNQSIEPKTTKKVKKQ